MLKKLLVPLIFLSAQFLIAWYGYFSSKLDPKGIYLGISYDSIFVRSLLTQFEYLWIIIIMNVLFSMGFNLGFEGYKNFLVIALIWIASGPIATLVFNALFVKEKIDLSIIIGTIFIVLGAIAVVAHKEITKIFS